MTAHAGFQVLGTVREVRITERGARKFKVAEIRLDLNQDESLVVEATHERLGAAQRLEPGDVVMVQGYLRSRQGGDRWFTSASAMCIAVATGSQVGKPTAVPSRSVRQESQPEMEMPAAAAAPGEEEDDVPF
jgi:hypothetical protein